jgi:hypothetical protein
MRPALLVPFFCLTIASDLPLVVLVGCSAKPKPAPAATVVRAQNSTSAAATGVARDETHRSAPRVIQVGEVRVVDEQKRFVLIDLQSNLYVPESGVILRAMRDTTETAKLKVSPERKQPFIAADIVEGEPAPGDQVVQ